ncbi:MAG: hypothetical protein J0I66_04600, partial [Microbacterium sp.]|nr:hypothetical protein [Microbacterium sp.]
RWGTAQQVEWADEPLGSCQAIWMDHGRGVLLGDAASSVTILGNGSSLALAGAQRLDAALRDGSDTRAALIRYERAHRPAVERNQKGAGFGAAFLVPRTRGGLWARNVAARVMRRV